jgi:hypothetical protein
MFKDELFLHEDRSKKLCNTPTVTQQWSSSMISPEGQVCGDFSFQFNGKGQGIIVWRTSWNDKDVYVQAAELNVN